MKRGIYILCFSIIIILTLSMVSAWTFWNKITGKANTATVGLNITVTSGRIPAIIAVYNNTITGDPIASGTVEGPAATYVVIVFNASDPDGVGNLNNATAKINITSADGTSATRQNTSCNPLTGQSGAYSQNYSCNITMWWFDKPGAWNISAYITDANGNVGYNQSVKNFSVGTTDGLKANQTALTWPSINPGATNTEANQFIGINNTGNRYQSLLVNSSDLIGETDPNKALGANNFTVKNVAGCAGTAMVNRTDTNITSAKLYSGNYTLNDGTAQGNLYVCLATSNADLSAQSYSTAVLGAWIVKIGQ
jgi:hypothetical protein